MTLFLIDRNSNVFTTIYQNTLSQKLLFQLIKIELSTNYQKLFVFQLVKIELSKIVIPINGNQIHKNYLTN